MSVKVDGWEIVPPLTGEGYTLKVPAYGPIVMELEDGRRYELDRRTNQWREKTEVELSNEPRNDQERIG